MCFRSAFFAFYAINSKKKETVHSVFGGCVYRFVCVCASVSAYLTISSDSFNQTLVFLLFLIMHNLMMQRALLFVLKYCGEVELLKLFIFF